MGEARTHFHNRLILKEKSQTTATEPLHVHNTHNCSWQRQSSKCSTAQEKCNLTSQFPSPWLCFHPCLWSPGVPQHLQERIFLRNICRITATVSHKHVLQWGASTESLPTIIPINKTVPKVTKILCAQRFLQQHQSWPSSHPTALQPQSTGWDLDACCDIQQGKEEEKQHFQANHLTDICSQFHSSLIQGSTCIASQVPSVWYWVCFKKKKNQIDFLGG